MKKQLLYTVWVVAIVVAMVLAGCTPAATPTPMSVATAAPTAASTAGATVAPQLDMAAVVDKYLTGIPDGFGAIGPEALKNQMAAAKPFLLDVREASEISSNGRIEGAVNIPIRMLGKSLDKLPEKDAPIVVYCAIGHRGAMAMTALQLLGYTNVKSLAGGLSAWKAANLPVVK